MANGDKVLDIAREKAYKLLDAQSLSSNGVWVERPAGHPFIAVDASAIETGGTCPIMVSNADSQPAASTDGPIEFTLDPSVTNGLAGGSVKPFKWWKAKKAQGGTPAASTVRITFSRG